MSNDAVDFNLLARSGVPTRSFKQGEVIFRQGDSATELYVIQSGRVGIRHRLLDTLEEHNIFGEMALIDNSPPVPQRWPRQTLFSFRFLRSSSCFSLAKRRFSPLW